MLDPQQEPQSFSADVMVHEERALSKNESIAVYRVYCPEGGCKISIVSVTDAAAALASLKEHLRVSHRLDATLTRREVTPIV